jgi:glycosyltransferase involved in cell wall biosynthesis
MSDAHRVLLITPVRNEAGHVERAVRSVAAQTRRPDLWLIVDDGSGDGTLEILHRIESDLPFVRVLEAPQRHGRSADRLAQAAELRAFHLGLATVDRERFTHIGKLDGDIELEPDYFERLLDEFAKDPSLGIAGGILVEPFGDDWREYRVPDYHVRGALKLYRRDCLDAIGGLQERLGWDTIDETYARMRGYTTRSFRHLVGRHHRHWGTAEGRLRGRSRHGVTAYVLRYGLPWATLRALKVARESPRGLSGIAFLFGYLRAAVTRTEKVEDPAFRRFVRRELRGRMMRPRSFYSV